MSKDYDKIFEWLKNEGNLPKCLKDFHDQKDIFKGMHELYGDQMKKGGSSIPNSADGHVYVIDYFLWYMGSRGYTLQKSRKKFQFLPFNKPTKLRDVIMSQLNKNKSKEHNA